jgi:hypothetical protein
MTGQRNIDITGDYHESDNKGQHAERDIINNIYQVVIQGAKELESQFSGLETNIGLEFHAPREKYEETKNRRELESKFIEIEDRIETLNKNLYLASEFQQEQAFIEIEKLRVEKEKYQRQLKEYQQKINQEEERKYKYPLATEFSKVRDRISSHPRTIWIIPIPVEDKSSSSTFSSIDIELKTKLQKLIPEFYPTTPQNASYQVYVESFINEYIQDTTAKSFVEDCLPGIIIAPIIHISQDKIFTQVIASAPGQDVEIDEIHARQTNFPEWEWRELSQILLERQELTEQNSHNIVRGLFVDFYSVLVIYLVDLYCLSINKSHDPKLYKFLGNGFLCRRVDILNSLGLSYFLEEWLDPFKHSLLNKQREYLEKDQREKKSQETDPYIVQEQAEAEESAHEYASPSYYSENYYPVSDRACLNKIIGFIVMIVLCVVSTKYIHHKTTHYGYIQLPEGSCEVKLRYAPSLDKKLYPDNIIEDPEKAIRIGERVKLIEMSGDGLWWKIKYKSLQHEGWVWSAYIEDSRNPSSVTVGYLKASKMCPL